MVWEVYLKQDGLDNLNLKENKNEQTSNFIKWKGHISKVKEGTVNTEDNEECLPGRDSHHWEERICTKNYILQEKISSTAEMLKWMFQDQHPGDFSRVIETRKVLII